MTSSCSWVRTATFSQGGFLYEAKEANNGIAVVRRHGRDGARLSKPAAVALIERASIDGDERPPCGSSFRLISGRPTLGDRAARALEAA